MTRIRGLVALVRDAVEHGSTAIEQVHLATARRPFAVLECIPLLAEPVQVVHIVHDTLVTNTYATIRFVAKTAAAAVDLGLAHAETSAPPKP
jgi:hypothetical protein